MTSNFRAFIIVLLVFLCCAKVFAEPLPNPDVPQVALRLDLDPQEGTITPSVIATQSEAASTPVNDSTEPDADPGLSGTALALILSSVGCAFIVAVWLCLRKK